MRITSHTSGRYRGLLVGSLLSLTLMTGCGADDPSSSDTPADAVSDSGSTPETAAEVGIDALCDRLTADQVGQAVGEKVTLSPGPMDSCEFDTADVRGLSGSFGVVDLDTGNGGWEAYRSGTSMAMDSPTVRPIEGLPGEAFVTTGTIAGGQNLQVAGAVLIGGQGRTLNLSQGQGMSAAALTEVSTALLTLLADIH